MTQPQPDQPTLSRNEWRAVAVAFNDAARYDAVQAPATSLRGRLGRIVAALTGNEAPRPLADPRLEALRRYVAASRRRHRPALDLAPGLIDQGFNCAQIRALGLIAA